MSGFKLVVYSVAEQIADLERELSEKGLKKSVEKRLDEINDISSVLPYLSHRSIQELMLEILYLIDVKEDNND